MDTVFSISGASHPLICSRQHARRVPRAIDQFKKDQNYLSLLAQLARNTRSFVIIIPSVLVIIINVALIGIAFICIKLCSFADLNAVKQNRIVASVLSSIWALCFHKRAGHWILSECDAITFYVTSRLQSFFTNATFGHFNRPTVITLISNEQRKPKSKVKLKLAKVGTTARSPLITRSRAMTENCSLQ